MILESLKITSSDILSLLKVFKTIRILFRSIIVIKKYTLDIKNIQYSGDVSWNVPVLSCTLSKRSPSAGLEQSTDISDSHLSLLKAEVVDRPACHVFVIFQTKRMNMKKDV